MKKLEVKEKVFVVKYGWKKEGEHYMQKMAQEEWIWIYGGWNSCAHSCPHEDTTSMDACSFGWMCQYAMSPAHLFKPGGHGAFKTQTMCTNLAKVLWGCLEHHHLVLLWGAWNPIPSPLKPWTISSIPKLAQWAFFGTLWRERHSMREQRNVTEGQRNLAVGGSASKQNQSLTQTASTSPGHVEANQIQQLFLIWHSISGSKSLLRFPHPIPLLSDACFFKKYSFLRRQARDRNQLAQVEHQVGKETVLCSYHKAPTIWCKAGSSSADLEKEDK